jgi:hypothetical protein
MNESQTIPRREDIDVYHSLDEASACKRFLGKSLDEAEALFRDEFFNSQEDLMWMGPVAFRYYIHAAIRYIQSDDAAGDSCSISFLASTLSFWLKHYLSELQPVAESLVVFCSSVVQNFDRVDADPEFCGDLRSDYSALVAAFQRLANDK